MKVTLFNKDLNSFIRIDGIIRLEMGELNIFLYDEFFRESAYSTKNYSIDKIEEII